jgi:hypothetical protein
MAARSLARPALAHLRLSRQSLVTAVDLAIDRGNRADAADSARVVGAQLRLVAGKARPLQNRLGELRGDLASVRPTGAIPRYRRRVPRKPAVKPPLDAADPRFIPVARALARTKGFSLMESKSGAMRGMMLNGKSFGMSHHGRFILKLTEERAAELIAARVGKAFSPGPGRVMKSWIEVTDPKADWVALAKEALRTAAAEGKRGRSR